ncbi:MAG: hypothetical protein ACRD2B_18670 [Terriglobia bacterium]
MCTSVDSLFTTVEAALQGVDVVLEGIGAAIPNPTVVAVEGAVMIAINGLAELKSLYDTYEADNTDTGIVGDIQAAVASAQTNLQGVLTAAHIDNATVQAWVTKVVNMTGTALEDVVKDVLPVVSEVRAAGSVSLTQAKVINAGMKQLKANFVSSWDAALENSGLDSVAPGVVKAAHDNFHHTIAPHIIRARV